VYKRTWIAIAMYKQASEHCATRSDGDAPKLKRQIELRRASTGGFGIKLKRDGRYVSCLSEEIF
jgi:hypothetical protein